MRELGTSPNREQVSILVDYLLTQNIPAEARAEDGQQVVWVHNEDDLDRAKAIWTEFQANPHDGKYVASRKPAKMIRKQTEKAEKRYASLYQDAYDFWGRPAPGRVPLTAGMILLSLAITFWSQFGEDRDVFYRFTFADPPHHVRVEGELVELPVPDRTESLRHGEYWRLITPIFLHLTPLHLVFGMYALFTLGGLVEFRRGPWWTLLFVLVTGVVSNTVQYAIPASFALHSKMRVIFGGMYFGGMSGVIYAYFGYLLAKTLYAPEPGLRIPRDTIYIVIGWFFLGMTGYAGPIANTAHAAGLAAGYAIGAAPKVWRQLRTRR